MTFVFPKYILTCQSVIHNTDDLTMTYDHVFETIIVKELPTNISFDLALGIEYSLNEGDDNSVIIKITDPNDEIMEGDEIVFNLTPTGEQEIHSDLNVVTFSELEIEEFGIYSINVIYNDDVITRQDILIQKEKEGDIA